MVEDPFLESEDKRLEYSDFLPNKSQLEYFWFAETDNGLIPQFKRDGTENSYEQVRDANVEQIWVVPGKAGKPSYSIRKSEDAEFKRTGVVDLNPRTGERDEEKFYVLISGDQMLYIREDGSTCITEDSDQDPRELID